MTKTILTALVLGLTVSACARVADSRFNPFNWFGRDRSETIEVAPEAATSDGRQLVAEVTELAVDQAPDGAIIRAVGLPPTQGFWDAELVRVASDDPTLAVYDFRVLPPLEQRRVSTQQSREIIAGAVINTRALAGIRGIVVRGQSNQRSVRR